VKPRTAGPPKDCAPAGQAAEARGATVKTDNAEKSKGGRPPLQVNGNARRAGHPAPTWPRPAGADALDALARCWNLRRLR